MSLKDKIVNYVLKTPENSNPNVLRSIIDNSSGGDSSNILIVNATPDMDHAESGNIMPLILDKTIDEMLVAECTVLVIDAGSGTYYVLHEVSREVNYGLGWFAMLDGTPMYAEASNDGAEHITGDTFATVDALTVAAAPFVLHGTMGASRDNGSISESESELLSAIQNDKRIIAKVSYEEDGSVTWSHSIDMVGKVILTSEMGTMPICNGSTIIDDEMTVVTVISENEGTLVFTLSHYTLTPAT